MIDPIATNLTFLPLRLSRNVIEHIIDAASSDLPDRSQLAYFLRIDVPEFPQSPTLVELTTMEGREKPPVTVAGATTYEGAFFQIDELLDGFLSLQKPYTGQNALTAIATLTMPFRLCQRIDPLPGLTNCPQQWVMKAGLSDVDFAGWGDRFFDTYQQQARKFLTWQPNEKRVGPGQPEFLYFLLNISPMPAVIRLRCDLEHADGYVQEQTVLELQNAQAYQVLCAPVGPDLLQSRFQAPGQSPIVRYRVWLANADNERLSEVRTYLIDARYQRNERHILFNNSLGGFDTLRLSGGATELLHVSRLSAERERPAGAGADFSELYVVETLGERTLTVSTGYIERSMAETLRYWDELMLAQEWYLVTPTGHVPLEMLTTDLLDVEDEPDMVARQFAFRLVASETSYSALPAAPAAPARATTWRGVGFRQLLDSYGKRTGLGGPLRLRKYYTDDNTNVRPVQEKPNQPGDPHYLAPTPIPGVLPGSTPHPSTLLSRSGTFKRSNCGSGYEGGVATIVIPAGRYGGETADAANALAEAEYRATNTQAFADANGSCAMSENYTWNVPAGQWHLRFSHPAQSAVFHNDGNNGPADMGNTQSLQEQNGPFVYAAQSNDMNFPVNDYHWDYYVFGPANAPKRVTLYRNGGLLFSIDITINRDGFERKPLLVDSGKTYVLNSGDLLYLKLEDR